MRLDRRDLRIADADVMRKPANGLPVLKLVGPFQTSQQRVGNSEGRTDQQMQVFPAAERLEAVPPPIIFLHGHQRRRREEHARAIARIEVRLMPETVDRPQGHLSLGKERNPAGLDTRMGNEFPADDAPAFIPGVR